MEAVHIIRNGFFRRRKTFFNGFSVIRTRRHDIRSGEQEDRRHSKEDKVYGKGVMVHKGEYAICKRRRPHDYHE